VVVLNKIDGQWDELKTLAEIDAEIDRQVDSCASILNLPQRQIFPVSAQKGLVAKINGDDALLERSRLPILEAALSGELIPAKQGRRRVHDGQGAGRQAGVRIGPAALLRGAQRLLDTEQ
jgi:hypothetical protein